MTNKCQVLIKLISHNINIKDYKQAAYLYFSNFGKIELIGLHPGTCVGFLNAGFVSDGGIRAI
jgi:hypothetical protein